MVPAEEHRQLKAEVPIEEAVTTKIIKAIEKAKIPMTKTKMNVNTVKARSLCRKLLETTSQERSYNSHKRGQ
jgi:hypothetical protein